MNERHGYFSSHQQRGTTRRRQGRRVWQTLDEQLATLAKALGHPARVRILRYLLECRGQKCACGEICEKIPLAQSTISQHLKMLREAGLIESEADGPRVCYSVRKSRIEQLRTLIAELTDWGARLYERFSSPEEEMSAEPSG